MKETGNVENLRLLDPQLAIRIIYDRKQYYKNNLLKSIETNNKLRQVLLKQKKENIKMRKELEKQVFNRNICVAICFLIFVMSATQFYFNTSNSIQDIQYVPKVPTSGKLQKTPHHVLSSVNLYNGGIQGSGTIISKGDKYSLLVSAAHNFKGIVGGKFWVYYPDGTYTEAELLAVDKERDLSLAKVNSETIIEYVSVSEELYKGDITGVGYTNNQGPNLKELQYTSGFYNTDKKYMWNFAVKSGPFWDGDSGGGIFADQSLIGVTSQRDAKVWKTSNCYEKRLYACSHKELIDFLKENTFDEKEYGKWNEKIAYKVVDEDKPPLWKPNPNIPLFIEEKKKEPVLEPEPEPVLPVEIEFDFIQNEVEENLDIGKMKRPSTVE